MRTLVLLSLVATLSFVNCSLANEALKKLFYKEEFMNILKSKCSHLLTHDTTPYVSIRGLKASTDCLGAALNEMEVEPDWENEYLWDLFDESMMKIKANFPIDCGDSPIILPFGDEFKFYED